MPGATNVDQFTPAREVGALRQSVRLLYHGRVDRRKGVLDFIRAGHQLLATGERVRLLVSGIGPDVLPARELVQELAMTEHTDFSGAVPYIEAARAYERGDVFISPTYAEGFSNTILEAMASGLPIVSTRSVGVINCLTDGLNAALVEPGDVDGLAQAIRRMIHDDAYRTRLAQQAYDDVLTKYSWPVVAEQLEGIYRASDVNLRGQPVERSIGHRRYCSTSGPELPVSSGASFVVNKRDEIRDVKKKRIAFVSPHLDDAVFSMGGLMAALAEEGHELHLITCFTRSVPDPSGFALACQLDKGLSAEVDYMALRRQEDVVACQQLSVQPHWLDLPEAPHRGYDIGCGTIS